MVFIYRLQHRGKMMKNYTNSYTARDVRGTMPAAVAADLRSLAFIHLCNPLESSTVALLSIQ